MALETHNLGAKRKTDNKVTARMFIWPFANLKRVPSSGLPQHLSKDDALSSLSQKVMTVKCLHCGKSSL